MKIGFTGTRDELTSEQMMALSSLLSNYSKLPKKSGARGKRIISWLHHGDCVGADATAHSLATSWGLKTVAHPPAVPALRAYCQADEIRDPLPYLIRNSNIVNETEILIACPKDKEHLRSGTWSTVRYARTLGRKIFVIYPDGNVITEPKKEST